MSVKTEIQGTDVDNAVEERELVQFEQADVFQKILLSDDFYPGSLLQDGPIQVPVLAKNDDEGRRKLAKGEESMRKLTSILDLYQEQSYLIDPYLEAIVVPVVKVLQGLVRSNAFDAPLSQQMVNSIEVQRLARLLYYYTKVRGYKTIIHFFPHAVEDLLPTLSFLECLQSSKVNSIWELRYILLLWLSLICMIPFDLQRFDDDGDDDDGTTQESQAIANRIQRVACDFLSSSGKERDAAAVVLGKLFQRKDASQASFASFLIWSKSTLITVPEPSIFIATGILQTLCNVVKAASSQSLEPHLYNIREILSLYSTNVEEVCQAAGRDDIEEPFHFSNNSLVNRFKAKMACRLGLKALKPRKRQPLKKATQLMGGQSGTIQQDIQSDDHIDQDVPEQVDNYIASLLDALKDKDTVVRYSAAKGLSRLCSRLPMSFVEQVTDAIIEMFSINIPDFLGEKRDLSNVSEFTWQGCCLALAELARRGLLVGENLSEKLEWVEKALMFDVRRGAHSVGTGVRDAACYVLWAIARAHEADSIRPMAKKLSHQLVCVALLDRDISIRRAASAAFQECVGRLGLFEHGIDIIRKTDFYAIGNRRNAFLVCAPMVAVHLSYREHILDHLLHTTIVHWDPSMRELGASSLAKIIEADESSSPLSPIVKYLVSQCKVGDASILHGALSSLAELAEICRCSTDSRLQSHRSTMFAALKSIPKHALRPLSPSMVIHSACRLLSASVTAEALQQHDQESGTFFWEDIISAAMKRQEDDVQIVACEALAAISQYQDCSTRIDNVIHHWKSLSVYQQQSNARAMGYYQFSYFSAGFPRAIEFLLSLVESQSTHRTINVEIRRNAMESMANAILTLQDKVDLILEGFMSRAVLKAMLAGLDDYTIDARGDVGSWVRLACLTGLRKVLDFLVKTSSQSMLKWVKQDLFDSICAGCCKQMIERIDLVRSHATVECLAIAQLFGDQDDTKDQLHFAGSSLFDQIFARKDDLQVKDPTWLLPRVVQLLLIDEYRSEVLKGIILCMGGQKESSNRIVTKSLCAFLVRKDNHTYRSLSFFNDVIQLASRNIKINRYFVPAIQTVNVLQEEGLIEDAVAETVEGKLGLSQCLELVCRNINLVKSIARVLASMQYTINLLAIPTLHSKVLDHIPSFLLHPFPTVRSSAAEALYSSSQDYLDQVMEEAEDILLSTQWAQTDINALKPVVDRLITLLSNQSA